MISEEIGLNAALEGDGIEVVETDLGEYLIQIRGETPSHIIAPAIHLTQDQVEADFRRLHTKLPADRQLVEPAQLVAEARQILREKFLAADVGITGANFLIAETGSSVIVTNEGNGDLTQSLPKVHIVLASIEKMVPTLEDVSTLIRLLARSATGQEISTYTTFSTGPRRAGDPDGPEACHVVILDNGRSELLGTDFGEVLRCIRCGACMNHCPVYTAIGGHAYGWVYPGPIGSVLTPALIGVRKAGHLPNASTFCGRCEEVCPMKIPLPGLMRHWREEEFAAGDTPLLYGLGLKAWAAVAKRPRLYHLLARVGIPLLAALGRRRGAFRRLPLARRLDQASRSRRAAGPHVPGAVGGSQGRGAPMSGATDGREAVIFKIRKALGDVRFRGAPVRRCRAPRHAAAAAGSGARQAGQGRSCAACSANSSKASRRPSSRRQARRRSRPRSPASCAPPTCRCGCASATTPISISWPGAASRRSSAAKARPWATTRSGSSHAAAAVAETGTLVLASGADNPVTLSYLPETHIVVVEDKDLVGGYEGAWEKIRARFGKRAMPRTVNFVSGPSRTADIGGQLVMGAHGPRRLCVILVRG